MKRLFKVGGFEFDIDADHVRSKPEDCARWGRIDMPGVTGFLQIIVRVEYHRWFWHWVKRYCIYYEL